MPHPIWELLSVCLSWRNLPLFTLQVLPSREGKQRQRQQKSQVYLVPALGSQHFKSFICGHIGPAVLAQSLRSSGSLNNYPVIAFLSPD